MHYELTETELYSLEDCMKQLDFITDLCGHITGYTSISIDGMQSFLSALQQSLYTTLKAVEERREAQQVLSQGEHQQPDPGGISHELLVRIMEACSGADVGQEALAQLNDELFQAAVNDGYHEAPKAFYAALQRQGYSVTSMVRNGEASINFERPAAQAKPKATARKRERLTTAAA